MWINLSGEILFELTEGFIFERGSLLTVFEYISALSRLTPEYPGSTTESDSPHFSFKYPPTPTNGH
jgi:hypothetical protein